MEYSAVLNFFLLILGYAILGASVKYGDASFDEKVFSQKKALLLSPFVSLVWFWLMLSSPASATILGSIVLAVLFSQKIDWKAFQLGFGIIFLLSVFFFLNEWMHFLWIPLIGLTIAGFLDEVGNDFVDKTKNKNKIHSFVFLFFRHRLALKIAVFLFAVFGFYGFEFFIYFLAWDLGYDGFGFVSEKFFQKGL